MSDQQNEIPEALRAQLSRAGKIGASRLTDDQRRRGGKASWAARVRKFQQQQQQQQQEQAQ